MRLILLAFLSWLPAAAQITCSIDIMPSSGTSAQIGHGIGAYTVNLHCVGIGPVAVPFSLVRMNFPELRIYSIEQGNDILSMRVERSWQARTVKYFGFSATAGGIGLSIEQSLNKKSALSGELTTAGGLAFPMIQALVSKDVPSYKIGNPPPDVIALTANQSGEYTWLAAHGQLKGTTVGPRRIDPILADPLKPKP